MKSKDGISKSRTDDNLTPLVLKHNISGYFTESAFILQFMTIFLIFLSIIWDSKVQYKPNSLESHQNSELPIKSFENLQNLEQLIGQKFLKVLEIFVTNNQYLEPQL